MPDDALASIGKQKEQAMQRLKQQLALVAAAALASAGSLALAVAVPLVLGGV